MPFNVVTDPKALNQALFQITHGLYVLTAASDGRLNGQCLDALMQVTSRPPRIAIVVNKRTLTHEMIASTGRFTVNVLDREDHGCPEVIQHFGFQSGRTVDKFAQFPHELGKNGLPILPDAKAFYECSVIPKLTLDLDTHTLVIASVDCAGTREAGEPLTYNEYRKRIKKRRE
jgi:flavin reductase (DIM6/NTAB) family NADH-FMN oxidoreductase RutF